MLREQGPDQLLLPTGQLKFIHGHGVCAWRGNVLTPTADRKVQVSEPLTATPGLGVSTGNITQLNPLGT